MTYEIFFTSSARLQLSRAARWWADNRSVAQASLWIESFEAAILQLAANPDARPLARENDFHQFLYPVRELTFGIRSRPTHRAIFEVRGRTVFVVGVRHLAQREFTPGDLGQTSN